MPVLNAEIASDLDKVAELLELEGANPFRIRAYRNAARVVGELPKSVSAMVAAGEKLSELPGIGEDLADKITTIARTGHLPLLDELAKREPPGLLELLAVPGLGPRRVRLLNERLGVADLAALAAAAKAGKVSELPGFGAKTEQNILRELDKQNAAPRRTLRPVAEDMANALLAHLKAAPGVVEAVVAGSYRRKKETVGDLDIVVAGTKGREIIEHFVAFDRVERVLARGPTRSSVRLRSGLQVDLRVVPEASFGAALQYFTGSKPHNLKLRQLAAEAGLKLNEYGLFSGARRVAGKTETEIYQRFALDFIEPELREDHGEIEAAREHRLPRLVRLADIRGDLHVHTDATDGRNTLEEMVAAARARGYRYVAVTDHSRHLTVAHGLDSRRLGRQIERIEKLNGTLRDFTVLTSIEVDILEDGRLDLPDSVLSKLDLVVGAIHTGFNLSRQKQTDRVLRAMDHPGFTILAHPTGRLLNERSGYELDFERIFAAAKERGCIIEVNGQPNRLDLADWQCKLARDVGVKLSVSTDAHSIDELGFMRFGVDQARRGWAEASDVVNTMTLDQVRRHLKRQ